MALAKLLLSSFVVAMYKSEVYAADKEQRTAQARRGGLKVGVRQMNTWFGLDSIDLSTD